MILATLLCLLQGPYCDQYPYSDPTHVSDLWVAQTASQVIEVCSVTDPWRTGCYIASPYPAHQAVPGAWHSLCVGRPRSVIGAFHSGQNGTDHAYVDPYAFGMAPGDTWYIQGYHRGASHQGTLWTPAFTNAWQLTVQ